MKKISRVSLVSDGSEQAKYYCSRKSFLSFKVLRRYHREIREIRFEASPVWSFSDTPSQINLLFLNFSIVSPRVSNKSSSPPVINKKKVRGFESDQSVSVEDQSEEGSFYRSKRFKRSGEAALWFRHLADTPCHVTNLPRNSIPTASGDNYRPRCWTLAHHRAVPGHLFALFHRTGDSPPCSFSANHRAPFLPAFFLSIHAAPFIPPSFFPPFPLPLSLLLSSLCTSYLLFFQCLALIRAFTSILALFSSFFLSSFLLPPFTSLFNILVFATFCFFFSSANSCI